MKKKILIIIIISLLIGYALGNLIPFSGFNFLKIFQKGIEGTAKLEITLLMDNGTPLANIEVDVAERPGTPPSGGISYTDENGIAVFNIKPGQYYIFFNSNSFPENLIIPDPEPIQVQEEIINQYTIQVKAK